jgi:hypothetical protein
MDEQKKLEEVLPIKPPFNAEEFWKQIGISELTAGCEGSCSRKKGFDLKAKTHWIDPMGFQGPSITNLKVFCYRNQVLRRKSDEHWIFLWLLPIPDGNKTT